ncbi:MAG TPA: lysophospholipid acyltransferase family protein [Candidatus Binatia bacterium]|nr:lysophospholipid acyltransferase family protein [Candidatus Binatia bacterium]
MDPSRLARLLPDVCRQALGLLLAGANTGNASDEDDLDPVRTRRSFWLVEQTISRYFRLRVMGAEHIPPGRALVVGRHSGVLPWDAACLVPALHRHTGRFSRNAGDALWARWAPVARYLAARGVVLGPAAEIEALLRRDELVLLFPGGAADMRLPVWERYRVKAHKGFAPGRGGYIKIALRTRSPVVPVAIVGAEEVHMLLADVWPLARLLGVPFFPIVASVLPLPARLYVRFGPPIRLDAPPEAAADQEVVDRLNGAVRAALQALIDDTRRRRRGVYWSSYDGDGAGAEA